MTSRNFGQFFTRPPPYPPIVTRFINKAFALSSQNPGPPFPQDRDVIYRRPLVC